MPERRQAASNSTTSRSTGVRRNLFHQHLSRRPTTSSTSTSAETLRLDIEPDSETSDIVIRDKNGDFEVGDPPMQSLDDQEEGGQGDAQEDESMAFAYMDRLMGLIIYRRGKTEIGRCSQTSSKNQESGS